MLHSKARIPLLLFIFPAKKLDMISFDKSCEPIMRHHLLRFGRGRFFPSILLRPHGTARALLMVREACPNGRPQGTYLRRVSPWCLVSIEQPRSTCIEACEPPRACEPPTWGPTTSHRKKTCLLLTSFPLKFINQTITA